MIRRPPRSTRTAAPFPSTTLFRSGAAAAMVRWALDRKALDHCLGAHVSGEPGHATLLDRLGRDAILNLKMRLGEGSGAALAINIIRAAVDCHAGMATFAGAGVSGPA